MLEDIFNVPIEVEIDGKKYKAEYDFKSYATLETLTGKGFYKLYNLLMVENNITLRDSIEIVCCSFLKNHSTNEVAHIREYLTDNLHAIKDINTSVIGAFILPMLPPEIMETVKEVKKKTKEHLKKI
jgi:hypothetical protein